MPSTERPRVNFPIRLKILVSVLFVVTAVVSVITFTMATMFHTDKRIYINDLVSVVGVGAAEETRSALVGYAERLGVFARVLADEGMPRESKSTLLQGMFEDFPELVGITLYQGGVTVASVLDSVTLAGAGVTKERLLEEETLVPLPLDEIAGGRCWVRNTTLSADLPMMTLALKPEGSAPGTVVAGLVHLDGLLRLARRTRVFEVSLADDAGILLAHRDAGLVSARKPAPLSIGNELSVGEHAMGLTREYERDDVKMLAGFAGVGFGGVVATAQIPSSAAFLATRHLMSRLLGVALGLLALAALVSLAWAHRLTRPVERLTEATREIAKGRFEIRVEAVGGDEIGELAGSFNQMAVELKNREDALEHAQAQLVQSAKMAAFGELGAGIAHEVKNPLAGILGCAQLGLRRAEEGSAVHKNLVLIEKETKRCKSIIDNLMRFARNEKAVCEPMDVNAAVDAAVTIVHHQLEMSGVKLEVTLADDLPEINGSANQIQQVLMNLIMNAQQAMEDNPGTVTVTTGRDGTDAIEIIVADDGPGIPPDTREHIFEPFFTTKPSGKGTGLGLSVSFGIVRDHNGEIRVESEPGKGTRFVVSLPVPVEHALIETLGAEVAAAAEPLQSR